MSTSSISSSSTGTNQTKTCIDLTPYAINPDFVSILQNTTGNVPDHAAVYFHIPSTFVAGETTYCLENIIIPESVGGKFCNTTSKSSCWLAVGYRHGSSSMPTTISSNSNNHNDGKDDEADTSQFGCVCSGSTMNNFTFPESSVADACVLEEKDRWGLGCRDSNHGRLIDDSNGTAVYSSVANAYISICPDLFNYCGVCGTNGGAVLPSFVVGVQWISNLQEHCIEDPFASYGQYCSNPRFSTTAIVAMAVGGSVALIVILALFLVYRKGQTPKALQSTSPRVIATEVEKQRDHLDASPPIREISVTSDGSLTN